MKRLKRQKGRTSRVPIINQTQLGDYSIVSLTSGKITAKQMATLIMTIKRKIPRGSAVKIIPRIFPSYPVTAKPLEVRMGKGKGSVSHRIARIRYNSIILELLLPRTRSSEDYSRILRQSSLKLPVRTLIKERRVLSPER
jgi:large subunit ribosomal protein L16